MTWMDSARTSSRRQFLCGAAAAPFVAAARPFVVGVAGAQRTRTKIRDLQVLMLQGPGRTYTLVKIAADSGHSGIAEAYGSPGVGVKEQVLSLKPWLVGKDPLQIDTLYTQMGEGTPSLSGTRTDGSAHNLMRAVSGIEMALWDLAGKILEVPASTLLGGRFRDKVRVYDHAAPKTMLDKAAVADWAAKAKAHPSGFTCHKFGFPHSDPATDRARDPSNRVLTTKELMAVQQGFENCRDAIGWDHDLMVHCHWEYDLRTAIQIAEAVESIQARVARGSAARRLFRFMETPVRRVEGADLHGREPGPPRRVQGLHPESGLRHPSPRPAKLRRLSRDQAHRRHGPRLRPADGQSQHRQPGLHVCVGAVGGVDSRLHRPGNITRRKVAGWTRSSCSTGHTFRMDSSRSPTNPASASS